jgi:uncharacterized membrane protein
MGVKKIVDPVFLERNMHKIFLVGVLFFGLVFSIALPLFNEPDGQYHFEASSSIVGLTSDLSAYGETDVGTGMDGQKASYQDGTHFQKYYVTQVQLMPAANLPRSIDTDITNYNFWGHLVPAVGIWLGYHIYPSVGVMVTVGRMFSMLVYGLIMFFIIKRVRHAKLLFAAVMLSPTAVNQFASLSYDAAGYVLTAATIALTINAIDRRRFTARTAIASLLLIVGTVLFTKENVWFMLLMLPIAWLVSDGRPQRAISGVCTRFAQWLKKRRFHIVCFVVVVVLVLLGAAVALTSKYGGVVTVAKRFFMTADFDYAQVVSTNTLTAASLASPYPAFNRMPVWTICVWFLLIFMIILAEKKFITSRFVSYGALVVFLLGVIGTYYGFLGYGLGISGQITGVQGRYFTGSILLLGLWAANSRFKLKVNGYGTVAVTTFVVVFVTNVMLVFNTIVNLMVGA